MKHTKAVNEFRVASNGLSRREFYFHQKSLKKCLNELFVRSSLIFGLRLNSAKRSSSTH